MSESEIIEASIVPTPQMQLGSLPIRNPKDLVTKATEMADALAAIITTQNLFKNINGRKYVMVEGWTTLGAMMGVVPIEEYCKALPVDNEGLVTGFEAKVKLIRAGDGGMVGAASAECTYEERNWKDRDSYALRSMAITRATGKAYRLSFSWIMKLAGFEPTPAEEMDGLGSREAAQEVATEKLKKAANGAETLTLTPWKEGRLALSGNGLAIIKSALTDAEKEALGIAYSTVDKVVHMPAAHGFDLVDACKKHNVPTIWMDAQTHKQPESMEGLLEKSIEQAKTKNGNGSANPIIVSAARKSGTRKDKTGKMIPWSLLEVVWGKEKYVCWDQKAWEYIEESKGKPAMFLTTPSFDGKKSPTIDEISRIGEITFTDNVPNV